MDTQGLWDTHTAQNLTTAIFALSTLISSHVVYNLTGRIQEDALQNLALFSQFGKRVLTEQRARQRQALAAGVEEEEAITAEGGIADVVASASAGADDAASGVATPSGSAPAAAAGGASAGGSAAGAGAGLLRTSSGGSSSSSSVLQSPGERLKQLRQRTSRRMAEAAEAAAAGGAAHPFQRIDLLVRDVQDLAADFHDLAAVEAENASYLEREVLKRGALAAASSAGSGSGAAEAVHVHEDIRSVREVIADAFACVGCFQLPHPGLHVPKPSFDGSLRSLEVDFRALVCQ